MLEDKLIKEEMTDFVMNSLSNSREIIIEDTLLLISKNFHKPQTKYYILNKVEEIEEEKSFFTKNGRRLFYYKKIKIPEYIDKKELSRNLEKVTWEWKYDDYIPNLVYYLELWYKGKKDKIAPYSSKYAIRSLLSSLVHDKVYINNDFDIGIYDLSNENILEGIIGKTKRLIARTRDKDNEYYLRLAPFERIRE